jgi:hypothetical protein
VNANQTLDPARFKVIIPEGQREQGKETHMKRLPCVLTFGLLAAIALLAQTPPKSAKGVKVSAAASPSTPQSDQDLNLQAYTLLLRADLNKTRSQIISGVMQFDADQAAVFWPIYKDFQADLNKVGDQIVDLVKDYVANYDTMTNETADKLATKLLDIEQQRNDLKRKYYEKLKTALDPITAARFLQVENQIERLVDLQVSSQLPVIDRSGR